MDINKALTFITEDDRWVTKLLVGLAMAFLSFLIIPALFLNGYMIQIVRNVMDGLENPLPEWDDWGKFLKDGFNLMVAGIVYTLPIWILMCCSFFFFIPAANVEGDIAEILIGLGAVSSLVMFCLVALFAVALMFIYPALTIKYAQEDDLRACFQFSEVLGIARDNLGDIIITLVIILVVGMVLGIVGLIPIVGWIIAILASPYITFVTGHLYGQIGAKVGGSPKEKGVDPTY